MVLDIYANYWELLISLTPMILGILITIILGWVIGRILGYIISRLMKKIGIVGLFGKTSLGKFFEASGTTTETLFDLIIRWIIYSSAILISLDLLNIRILDSFVDIAISYLPNLIGGLFTLIFGLIIVDYLVDSVKNTAVKLNLKIFTIILFAIKFFLYFVVIVMSLSILKVDVEILYTFSNAIAAGVALGIFAGLGIAIGWGLKDLFAKNAENVIKEAFKTLDEANDTLEVTELKSKVDTLEKKLVENENKIKDLHTIRMDLIEELSIPSEDVYNKIQEVIEGKGVVSVVSNGFKIVVIDPMIFPWFESMIILRANKYDVWVSSENENLVIKCKLSSE